MQSPLLCTGWRRSLGASPRDRHEYAYAGKRAPSRWYARQEHAGHGQGGAGVQCGGRAGKSLTCVRSFRSSSLESESIFAEHFCSIYFFSIALTFEVVPPVYVNLLSPRPTGPCLLARGTGARRRQPGWSCWSSWVSPDQVHVHIPTHTNHF